MKTAILTAVSLFLLVLTFVHFIPGNIFESLGLISFSSLALTSVLLFVAYYSALSDLNYY